MGLLEREEKLTVEQFEALDSMQFDLNLVPFMDMQVCLTRLLNKHKKGGR